MKLETGSSASWVALIILQKLEGGDLGQCHVAADQRG